MKSVPRLLPALLILLLFPDPQAISQAQQSQPAASEKAKRLRQESRVWILRGLQSEFATLRKPAPRGDQGIPLDTQGAIDEKELLRLNTNNGIALRPGDLVQITAIRFKDKEIIFELNGGGKKKRRWFERIEVGMGGSTRPVNTSQSMEMPTGSSIVLAFGAPLPDLTSDDLKRMLAPALDFTRRSASVLYTETLPKEIQEAIKNNQVLVGMDREMVLASRGRPERKVRESRGGVELEDWIYGKTPSKILFVTFDGDKVVEVKEFTPGVASEAARAAEKAPAESAPAQPVVAPPPAPAPAPAPTPAPPAPRP